MLRTTRALSEVWPRRRRDALGAGHDSQAERASFGIPTDRPLRPGMDHASPQRRDLLERGLHLRDSEVGQRERVSRSGATFVNAQHRSAALGLPAATLALAPLAELDAEQARPEPPGAIRIISRELDQAERSIHVADDNAADILATRT